MNANRAGYCTAVTMAGFAVSLVLAGCAPQTGTGPAASSPNMTISDTAESMRMPAFAPASSAATVARATTALPALVVSATSAKPAAPALKTFTFPDGHISFAYPATWTVRTVLPPAGVPGVEAIVADGAGNDLLSLGNGFTAGCTGGPVSRRVFDQVAVPGMTAPDGTEPVFGFAVESYGDGDAYFMGLSRSPVPGTRRGRPIMVHSRGNRQWRPDHPCSFQRPRVPEQGRSQSLDGNRPIRPTQSAAG